MLTLEIVLRGKVMAENTQFKSKIAESDQSTRASQLEECTLELLLSAWRDDRLSTQRPKTPYLNGPKQNGDADLPGLHLNSLGMQYLTGSRFRVFSGPNYRSIELTELKKIDKDGSAFGRFHDGTRRGEIHWGSNSEQRYVLRPCADKTWRGYSSYSNDDDSVCSIQIMRDQNGKSSLNYDNVRKISIHDSERTRCVEAQGVRPSENFALRISGKNIYAAEISADGERIENSFFSQSKRIVEARTKLLNLITDLHSDSSSKYKMQADMMYLETQRLSQLQENLVRSGLAPVQAKGEAEREISGTYENAAKLVEFKTLIQDRTKIDGALENRLAVACAEQIIAHAARPTEIDQGNHPTCAAACVEVRTYMRHPAAAARLLADMAVNGYYRGSLTGKELQIDPISMLAHQEATRLVPQNENRGIASQIFQVAAYNMMYKLAGKDLEFKQEEINQLNPRGDHMYGDRANTTVPVNHDNWVLDAYSEIVGRKEPSWIVSQSWFHKFKANERGLKVDSEEQLKDLIQTAARTGNFPLVICVDTRNSTFTMGSAKQDGSKNGGLHAISIVGIRGDKIELDNQWGNEDDRLGRQALSIKEVFSMMNNPDDPIGNFFRQFKVF